MGAETLLDKIRSIIAGVAWRTLLWSLRMSPDEYWNAVYEQEKSRIDRQNATKEF
jgi:hypothetical protein